MFTLSQRYIELANAEEALKAQRRAGRRETYATIRDHILKPTYEFVGKHPAATLGGALGFGMTGGLVGLTTGAIAGATAKPTARGIGKAVASLFDAYANASKFDELQSRYLDVQRLEGVPGMEQIKPDIERRAELEEEVRTAEAKANAYKSGAIRSQAGTNPGYFRRVKSKFSRKIKSPRKQARYEKLCADVRAKKSRLGIFGNSVLGKVVNMYGRAGRYQDAEKQAERLTSMGFNAVPIGAYATYRGDKKLGKKFAVLKAKDIFFKGKIKLDFLKDINDHDVQSEELDFDRKEYAELVNMYMQYNLAMMNARAQAANNPMMQAMMQAMFGGMNPGGAAGARSHGTNPNP